MHVREVKHDEDKYCVHVSMAEYIIFFTKFHSYLYIVFRQNIAKNQTIRSKIF